MRPAAAAVLLAALLGACAPAAASDPAGAPSAEPVAAGAILVSDGGMLRPLENGGRVAIPDGRATITFSPLPLQRSDLVLEVAVLDGEGHAVEAAVDVTYEMVQMDHGAFTVRTGVRQSRHRLPIAVVMPGSWRFTVRIDRSGDVTTVILVLPEAG